MKRYILSIESSCDDSSIAITDIDTFKVVFHKKISQDKEHSIYGGVVPELAARLHVKSLPNILSLCISYLDQVVAVGVTVKPGLVVSLIEGVTMAKALSIALNVPLFSIDHLDGHIYSLFIEKSVVKYPFISLLISGGHTRLIEVKFLNDKKIIADCLDDSFGESFDKVAKMMGLGYPGGPIIEEMAKEGDENRFDFSVPLKNSSTLAFSYSGLKNQVRIAISKIKNLSLQDKKDISASFQKCAIEHLLQMTRRYFNKQKPQGYFSIIGGASANMRVREEFEKLCNDFGKEIRFAKLEYCSDNAAMIGRYAIELLKEDEKVNR